MSKIDLKTLEPELMEALWDSLVYGNGYIKVHYNGQIEHIHPRDLYKQLKSNPEINDKLKGLK